MKAEIDSATLDRLTAAGLRDARRMAREELRECCTAVAEGKKHRLEDLMRQAEIIRACDTLLSYYGAGDD